MRLTTRVIAASIIASAVGFALASPATAGTHLTEKTATVASASDSFAGHVDIDVAAFIAAGTRDRDERAAAAQALAEQAAADAAAAQAAAEADTAVETVTVDYDAESWEPAEQEAAPAAAPAPDPALTPTSPRPDNADCGPCPGETLEWILIDGTGYWACPS